MMINKIATDVSEEEIRELFKSDERRVSVSSEEESLTPAEIVKMLQEEYSVLPRLAEASIAALSKSSDHLEVEKCFEWTLENEALLTEEDLEEREDRTGPALCLLPDYRSSQPPVKWPGLLVWWCLSSDRDCNGTFHSTEGWRVLTLPLPCCGHYAGCQAEQLG